MSPDDKGGVRGLADRRYRKGEESQGQKAHCSCRAHSHLSVESCSSNHAARLNGAGNCVSDTTPTLLCKV